MRLPVERVLLVTGVVLLAIFAGAMTHRWVSSRLALAAFDKEQMVLAGWITPRDAAARVEDQADFSLWSEKRIREYRASFALKNDAPIAVLRIEKLGIRVPVFQGDDELVLNRGVGWVEGTTRPGTAGNGNIGIAGHRDGFFRALKDIAVGETVELATRGVVSRYSVDSIEIVYPENVGVLRPRGRPSLTLVTCYPFYFVGDAPQRFIVHASLTNRVEVDKSSTPVSAPAGTEYMESKEKRR